MFLLEIISAVFEAFLEVEFIFWLIRHWRTTLGLLAGLILVVIIVGGAHAQPWGQVLGGIAFFICLGTGLFWDFGRKR